MAEGTDPVVRYTATQRASYRPYNFRRWGKSNGYLLVLADDPKIIPQRDYNDYAKYVNENNTVKR